MEKLTHSLGRQKADVAAGLQSDKMAWLRDIDAWFMAQVLPSAATYRSYARRLVRDDAEAEDLVQEAYAKILAMGDWQKIDAPDRFVLRAIRNLALDRFRREKIVSLRQAGRFDIEAFPDPAPDAFVTTSARQELDIVMAAISTLPVGCRQVLILRKMHGYSPKQIAEK